MDENLNKSVTKEDVGTMLPNVGLDGKPSVTEDEVEPFEEIQFSESVLDYINDPYLPYNSYVEEGVKDIVNKVRERVVVSGQTAKLVVDIYILKKKLKRATKKDPNSDKVIDLKRELIRKQKELNNLKKSSSPELQKEIGKIENNLEKVGKTKENVSVNDVKTESTIITEETDDKDKKEEEKKILPPDLKRLDETRGRIEELNDEIRKNHNKLMETGEKIYENKIKGLTYKKEKLEKELKEKEEKVKKFEKKLEEEKKKESTVTEAAEMEDEIRPIVNKLNAKGYKVKYASPGHHKLRKKEDKEPDGVYYGKLYSDARIMFKDKYDFANAPKYWHWREVDGCSYLDITPITYNKLDGTPDEAFSKWKENYMNTLSTFVDNLHDKKSSVKKESLDEFTDNMVDHIFEKAGIKDIEMEYMMNESTDSIDGLYDSILSDLNDLLQ